jgi:hypothetical protein
MRGKAVTRRLREGALERLTESKFFDKVNKKGVARTEAQWQKRKDQEIETLEVHLGIRQGAKKKREEIILD